MKLSVHHLDQLLTAMREEIDQLLSISRLSCPLLREKIRAFRALQKFVIKSVDNGQRNFTLN